MIANVPTLGEGGDFNHKCQCGELMLSIAVNVERSTAPPLLPNVCYAFGFLNEIVNLKTDNMYKSLIDPEKWVNIGELELEQNKPYWFKKSNGQIVMGTPYTNGYSSGIADVYFAEDGLKIKTNTFHILRGGQVQEVLQADA